VEPRGGVTGSYAAYLHNLAHYLVRRWFRRKDEAMVEDCVMAGWEAVVRYGADCPTLRLKIRDAMMNELARWLYGVGRSKADRLLKFRVSLEDLIQETTTERALHPNNRLPDPLYYAGESPESYALNRVTIQRIVDNLPPRSRRRRSRKFMAAQRNRALAVWEALVLEGTLRLPRGAYQQFDSALNFTEKRFWTARQHLREAGRRATSDQTYPRQGASQQPNAVSGHLP